MKNHFNNYFDELVTNRFFPKITLPIRIGERSSSLIDISQMIPKRRKQLAFY